MNSIEELSLADRLKQALSADSEPIAGSTVALKDDSRALVLTSGSADLFVTASDLSRPVAWFHVGRISSGTIVPHISPIENAMLIARPTPGAEILEVAIDRVATLEPAVLAAAVDPVLDTLGKALSTELRPRKATLIEESEVMVGSAGAGPAAGEIRWVVGPSTDNESDVTVHRWGSPSQHPETVWLASSDWVTASTGSTCTSARSVDLDNDLLPTVTSDMSRWLQAAVARRQSLEVADVDRTRLRADQDEALEHQAEVELARVLAGTDERRARLFHTDPAFASVALVGDLLGFTAQPARSADIARRTDPVSAVVRASHVRERTVRLEGGWFSRDVGPLVGFLKDGMHPVVLRRQGPTYVIDDPTNGTVRPIDETTNKEIFFEARMLYAPLPEESLSGLRLLTFGAAGSRGDVIALAWTGLVIALLGLLTPILTGQILGTFVPRAARDEIAQWSIILIVVAAVIAGLSTVQNLAALRLEGRVDMNAQAAIWDRLMSLPAPFFRRNSIGQLSAASLGVNGIRDVMSGLAVQSLLSFIMGLANLFLMLYYDLTLGLVALVVVGVGGAVSVRIGTDQIRVQRQVNEMMNEVSSITFQLMSGVAKLRVAAAEERAFAYWSRQFAGFRRQSLGARRIQNKLVVFNAGYAVVAPAIIFAFIGLARGGDFPVATFLTFNVAFLLFLASTLKLTGTGITLLNTVPMFERLQPILSSRPEIRSDLADPGELSGHLEVSHLTFSYEQDQAPVLSDVSFEANPGEFVALVGPSGCGKSTLLRMLLGFENADSGSVQYDGQDLSTLDVGAVRRQCGVVLQQGQLFAGDILSNIVGSSTFTVDDAWEAAEMAGMREDIEHMPMGMNTLLSEGASTLSGGQRQRLMIARALLARPRIIFFDEATSALDNRTQSIVTESMRRLNATRIVIAHRLSTIRDADRIVVLESGRVTQMGTYDELIGQEGLFRALASRQTA